jgi:hypothetical protein
MTPLPNRPNTAPLVIDMQTVVVAKALARDAVVANIAARMGAPPSERY